VTERPRPRDLARSAHHEAVDVHPTGTGALDLPAPLVPSRLVPALRQRLLPVFSMRANYMRAMLRPALRRASEARALSVGELFGPLAGAAEPKRVPVAHWAVDHYHSPCALAALGLPDA
jgi:hypothetical protein